MKTNPNELATVLVTDCGSTTTKALLFERTTEGWRQTFRGEAPTTVEEPVADVTVGAFNAFTEIQELSGRKILTEDEDASPFSVTKNNPKEGIDLYLSTSSAGGGLQMVVAGAVRQMTTESAERAALGAGAIVMDALSADDEREEHERIEQIRHLRPDIVLVTGGVDGGAVEHVVEVAELLLSASPRPRFGNTLRLPVVYAGNRDAAQQVKELLSRIADVAIVDNVRPSLDRENLGPAREAIHEFFLNHVMSHSPGYGKLLEWTPVPILPTPAAVGNMISKYGEETGFNILCTDIGGATTDVFSLFHRENQPPAFNRTVSANLGMSYSIANVLLEAGVENIIQWLPYSISSHEVRDRLRNKMIRPTTIPQTMEDLWLEQAVCREALRLSLAHHRSLATGLSGLQQQRSIADLFSQRSGRDELVDLMKLDMVIGSGGVLSHAPHRLQAALMMIDGFGLEGITELTVDSIFMLPHLGVLASIDSNAAMEILERDCIVRIGHAIAPVYPVKYAETSLAEVKLDGITVGEIKADEVTLSTLQQKGNGELQVIPKHKSIDVGNGPGEEVKKTITIGEYGFILDGRNRPLQKSSHKKPDHEIQREILMNLKLVDPS